MISRTRLTTLGFGATVLSLVLTGCSGGANSASEEAGDGEGGARTVTVITHESFPSEEFAAAASEATGYTVEAITAGDGGELTNRLVLSQGEPLADVFFGVDSFFASRLIDESVVVPYEPSNFPESGREFLYDSEFSITPIDEGAVCMNTDPAWFADAGIAEPETYEDLLDETYRGQTVVLDPASSSTGMAFLAGTVAHFGEDGYEQFWSDLIANDARIENGWTDAYNGQFTQGGGDGTYPIVLSYASSPAWTVNEAGTESSTRALTKTCTSQVEYAGILDGTENLEGAQAVMDFFVSPEFQNTIAETMYMNPIDDGATVPDVWDRFVESPETRNDVDPVTIGERRDTWLRAWTDAVEQ